MNRTNTDSQGWRQRLAVNPTPITLSVTAQEEVLDTIESLQAEVETLRQTLAATRNVFWARSIQLELLKMDCARLLQWVRNPKYPEDVSRWVRTNVEMALRRAEIPVTEDAAVKRRLRYEQESHDVQP